jgi:hypothetical protein
MVCVAMEPALGAPAETWFFHAWLCLRRRRQDGLSENVPEQGGVMGTGASLLNGSMDGRHLKRGQPKGPD